ncbi:MAG: zinc-binding alcohol dehydrogenase family protein [Microvirga sp.]
MHAVGFLVPGSVDREDALVDIELPMPEPGDRDLLVEIKAVSVNPVDYQVRKGEYGPGGEGWTVLGWDAAGVVSAVGRAVTLFRPGDEVFYAGSILRPGTNAQFHLVDERIVGAKPRTLDWAAAAALPLTAITAWEALFDRLDVRRPVRGAAPAILIIGGGGGVSSMAVQIAKAQTDLTVIATSSRPETTDWVRGLGADHVVDHTRPLAQQVAALGLGAPAFVFSTTHTDRHIADIAELIAPQGRFGFTDDPTIDIELFKPKAVSIHYELMFTRTMFDTADVADQGALLNEVSRLVDAGMLRTTMTERHTPIDAATLKRVHASIESGRTMGKIVVEGFA